MSQPSLTCCVPLGRTLTLSGPHLPHMQNEGIGQADVSEATFTHDFLGVVSSLGTVGPVFSSQPYQEMLTSSLPSRGLIPEGQVEGVLTGTCVRLTESGENVEVTSQRTWVSASHPSALPLPRCGADGVHGQLWVRPQLEPGPSREEFLSRYVAHVLILPLVCCVSSHRPLSLSEPELAESQIPLGKLMDQRQAQAPRASFYFLIIQASHVISDFLIATLKRNR